MLQNVKSVLIGITEEGKDEPLSALSYGLSFAHQAGAHLTVQAASVKLVLTHALVSRFAAGLVAAENRRLSSLSKAIAERAFSDAAAAGVICTTENPHLSFHDLLEAFVAQARVHDLTIVDSEKSAVDIDRNLIEKILFESGRPIIIVPPGRDRFVNRRVIVAWDGSGRAARAVNDALPILRAASVVEVLCIADMEKLKHSVPGAEIAPHLARHGVNVSVKNLALGDREVAQAICDEAETAGADLLVMGAFSHWLVREQILGGVTQALLKTTPVPIFMAC